MEVLSYRRSRKEGVEFEGWNLFDQQEIAWTVRLWTSGERNFESLQYIPTLCWKWGLEGQ